MNEGRFWEEFSWQWPVFTVVSCFLGFFFFLFFFSIHKSRFILDVTKINVKIIIFDCAKSLKISERLIGIS